MSTHNLLPENFLEIDLWKDLVDAIHEIAEEDIYNEIRLLESSRDIDAIQNDQQHLIQVNNLLGNFYSNSDLFTLQEFRRFITYSPFFLSEKGNRASLDFLGWVINGIMSIEFLSQRQEFETEDREKIHTDYSLEWNETFFPISHIALNVFKVGDRNLDLSELRNQILQMFYATNPVHIVVDSINIDRTLGGYGDTTGFSTKGLSLLETFLDSIRDIPSTGEVNSFGITVSGVTRIKNTH